MSKRTRNLLIIVAALVVVVIIAVLSSHRGAPSISVTVKPAAYARFRVTLPENGIVQRPNTQTVPALVAGNLGEIYVKAGAFVQAGQVLATIDAPTLESNAAGSAADFSSAVANIATSRVNEQNAKVQYQASVDTAKSALDEAQRVYLADVNLFNNKAIAKQQVDADKAKRDQAQVQYEQALAQLHLGAVSGYGQNSVQAAQAMAQKAQIVNSQNQQQLGFTRVVAPFSGIIQTVAANPSDPLRPVQPGDPVTAGQALFTIAHGNGFIVKAQVDEQDIAQVRVGQRVGVTGEDFANNTFHGHVATIDPTAQKSTDPSSTSRQVLTTIALDNQSSILRDGMSADVDIYTTDIPSALQIPTSAIVSKNGSKYVFVVRGKVAKKTAIKTGPSNDTSTIVKSGLGAGNRVVLTPAFVTDGARVDVLKPSPSPSASPTG